MSAAVVQGNSPERSRRHSRHCEADRPRLKTEPAELDIKDYAETTMNELLGWYGYDKLDARGIHLPPSSSSSSPLRGDDSAPLSDSPPLSPPSPHHESESTDLDMNGGTITCGWCLKTGLKLFTLKTSSGKTKAFCSEHCFNQCRRAAFKKNRVCNWCRHVRHTVNYVDFKDGDEQLQFCSDKCLNQYKMQIFCKETQAYLQMNPHLQEEASKAPGTMNSKLITPDLWLRDCNEANGGMPDPTGLPRSDDDSKSPHIDPVTTNTNGEEIEDLTLSSKLDRCKTLSNSTTSTEELSRDRHDSPESSISCKEKPLPDHYSNSSLYLREERVRSSFERKKRYHDSERDHIRKRQKVSSSRHRSNPEAPPAHSSSTSHSPLPFQNQSRIFSSHFPQSLGSGSLNPPAAHTKSLPSHSTLTTPRLYPNLPPPPPLLNNDFHTSPFASSLFQHPLSPQLDAMLRIQAGLRHGESYPMQNFQEPVMPMVRGGQSQNIPAPFVQPNTVMLPYPIFVPLPVPIPIPIPLSNFMKVHEKKSAANNGRKTQNEDNDLEDLRECSSTELLPNQKSANVNEDASDLTIDNARMDKIMQAHSTSYAITNNDSQTNKLTITRNKNR